MRTVAASSPVIEVIEATRATGHSRFPVIGDSVDDIRGIVHVKQAVAVPVPDRGSTPVGSVMSKPVLVPPFMHLGTLLSLLQQRGLQLAAVIDEFYGGTAGIVTFEDLVEELVGDVLDGMTRPRPRFGVSATANWLLSGLLRPDEVRAACGFELPPGRTEYETIAGLILRVRDVPHPGDRVDVPGGSTHRLSGWTAGASNRVRLSPEPDPSDAGHRGDRPGAPSDAKERR